MALEPTPVQRTTQAVDVVIVGAGLSGLRAADELYRNGLCVVVLEALGRIGGQTLSARGSPGIGCGHEGWVELGGAWINETTQREMARLRRRFGFESIGQQGAGYRLVQKGDGSVEISEDAKPPWRVVSVSEEDGGSYCRIRRGAQRFSSCLADQIPQESLHLSTPVTKITQRSDACLTQTAWGDVFSSKRVIVSIPNSQYQTISFNPPLPPPKDTIPTATIPYPSTKVALLFDSPWWREAGLSGSMESAKGPIFSTSENCSEEDNLYAIECLIGGEAGREWFGLSADKKEARVWAQFAEVFSARIGSRRLPDPVRIFPKDWNKEFLIFDGPVCAVEGSREVPTSEAGRAAPWWQPMGRVHFVGSDTADEWRGQMEGAVWSGVRGAHEVIDSLRRDVRQAKL